MIRGISTAICRDQVGHADIYVSDGNDSNLNVCFVSAIAHCRGRPQSELADIYVV